METNISRFVVSVVIVAGIFSSTLYADDLADRYFSKQNPSLSPQEREALNLAQKWKAGTTTGVKAFSGRDGSVQFVFGVQQTSVVCAVLQVCDLALQPGEQVNSLNIGDPARWTMDPAISGTGSSETQHIIIKPMDVGLDTTLTVTTDRRVYHIRLRSHRTQFMPYVSWTYPEDTIVKWEGIQRREKVEREEKTIPATGEYLGNLSFDYDLDGAADWKPVRVYNDGRKTIIQMPKSMAETEAPSLLVVRREGGLFSDDETVMVNYRVQGDRYIVDSIFDKAILIAGVGKYQDRITITRRK